jgi:hypothetical protein
MRQAWFIAAISIVAGWASPDAKAAADDKDFDLACAVVSAAEIGTTAVGSEEQGEALQIQMFYLGRLSARDDKTYWKAVINGRLAEMREKAKSPDMYITCLQFVTKQIE